MKEYQYKPMNLNDLVQKCGIDPHRVVVMRHRPQEPELNNVFPWLAGEKKELFNAYQQSHGPKVQSALEKMCGHGYLASFIGIEPGEAVFVGLYEISGAKPVLFEEYWNIPDNIELAKLGMVGWKREDSARYTLKFDLKLSPLFQEWSGKLTVAWPPPERSWFRRSERNEMRVVSIPRESMFIKAMPAWETIRLTWSQLKVIPSSWRLAFSQWRGIYFIYDETDGRGYVGSAYGENNLLGRWLGYAKTGDGENKLLRLRDPQHFHFSILQRVSPDMSPEEVIRLESTWKDRLHTRGGFGLNVN